jgi:hypothetical protein
VLCARDRDTSISPRKLYFAFKVAVTWYRHTKLMRSAQPYVLLSLTILGLSLLAWHTEAAMPTLSQCNTDLTTVLPDCLELAAGIPVNVTLSVVDAVKRCGGEAVSAAKCVIDNLLDYSSVCSSELSAASTCLRNTLE